MTKKPNVLYIITHDQGIAASCYADYGPGASKKMITPNIDSLAEKGVLFTNHFGTAPQCSPARGSLMTSRSPHMNGLIGLTHRGFKYNDPSKTVVNHFRKSGYNTELIGFQHEYQGDLNDIGYQQSKKTNYHRRCRNLLDTIEESLIKLRKDNDNGIPFWLSIGLREVHLAWRNWIKRNEYFKPENVEVPGYLPDTKKVRKHLGEFYGCLKSYDSFLGELWKLIDKYNLREDTIIIVTTDHGIAHPRAKGTLYDPGNHNLMIWANPKLPQGKKVHSLLSSIDFAPTICEMCDIEIPIEFMGKSYKSVLTSELNDNELNINEYIFTEITYHDVYNPIRAVRSKRYKYIQNFEPKVSLIDSIPGDIQKWNSYKEWKKKGSIELITREEEEFYDLQEDPLELNNILKEDPNNPEYLKLRKVLTENLEKDKDPILKGPYPAPSNARISNSHLFDHLK